MKKLNQCNLVAENLQNTVGISLKDSFMNPKQFKLKSDVYRKARGGYARFLNIFCESCETHLFLYQKDGPGGLRRMYLDRIFAPEVPKNTKEFMCPSCQKIIGTFIIYKKENRSAIRLYQDAVMKKVGKGEYLL